MSSGIKNSGRTIKSLKQAKKMYSWDKLNQETYLNCINLILLQCDMESTEKVVEIITSSLKRAADQAVLSKTLKFEGPKRPVSKEVLICLKTVKETYEKWENAGKPRTGNLFLENKPGKRTLRSRQRIEEVLRRESFYDSLMEDPSSAKFYQLIKRSRPKTECCLFQVDGAKYFDPEEQR